MNEKYSQRQFSTLTGIARATLQLWAKNGKLAPAIEINGKKFYSDEQKEIALRLYISKNTSPTATDVPKQNVGNLTETALAASNSRLKAFREVAQNEKVTNGQPDDDSREVDSENQLTSFDVSCEGTAAENDSETLAPMNDNQNEKINSDASKNSGDLSNGEVSTENILANLPKRKPHNTRDILAKMAGVSSRTLGKVEKIEKLATAEIKAALRARELSIDAAYKGVLAGATTVDEVKEFNRRKFKTPPAPVETFETPTTIELASASEIITLEDRANKIRQLQADVQRGIVEIGFELIVAKKEIGHGGWADWLATNFDWTQQTANRFMRVSERFGKLNNVVQFKPSTLQAMLALPEGDEDKFIEAQADKGKPLEDLSAREVKAAVEDWNQQHNEETNNFSFSRDKTHDSGDGKIAAVVAPCVEEESISEETAPASPAVNLANGTVAPCVEKRTLNEKFRIMSHETYTNIREMIEETNDLQTAKIIHDSLLELAQGISEVILLLESRIAELLNLNGGDSND